MTETVTKVCDQHGHVKVHKDTDGCRYCGGYLKPLRARDMI